MWLHHDLAKARMAEEISNAQRHNEARRLHQRGSPVTRVRLALARRIVLIGAGIHGRDAAVIGRVVILDPCGCGPSEMRQTA